MCGISGFHFFDPSNPPMRKYAMENLIDSLLLGIEHRGKDATGVAAVMPTGELHIEKADLDASRFVQWRKDIPGTPQTVLLHTRYATQGSPMNLNNNHPLRVNNAVAIHNGHISNDDEIFADESLSRIAQVDSECIPALFDKYGIEKAHIPLGKLDGNFAVAVSDLRKPGVLVLGKGWSSPLEYYLTKHGIMWASTQQTIKDAMKETFGIKVDYNDIKSLSLGTLLYIEDGAVEKYPFELYQTPAQTASANWDRQWGSDEIEEGDYWPVHKKDEDVDDDGFSCLTTFAKMFNKMKEKNKEDKDIEKSIKDSVSGELHKSDSKHVEFWRSEPHDIAYTVISGDWTFLFKECDLCETAFSTTLLNISEQGDIFCDDCYKIYLEDAVVEQEDNPAVIHEIVVSQIAENYGTTDIFVNWLLFDTDDEEVVDTPDLYSMFEKFKEDYEAFYDLLTGRNGSGLNNLSKLTLDREDAEIVVDAANCECEAGWHDIYEQCEEIEIEEIEIECSCEGEGCWNCKPEPGNPDYDAWYAMSGSDCGVEVFEEELSDNGAKTLAALRAAV